jgi:hypothetical protein
MRVLIKQAKIIDSSSPHNGKVKDLKQLETRLRKEQTKPLKEKATVFQ